MSKLLLKLVSKAPTSLDKAVKFIEKNPLRRFRDTIRFFDDDPNCLALVNRTIKESMRDVKKTAYFGHDGKLLSVTRKINGNSEISTDGKGLIRLFKPDEGVVVEKYSNLAELKAIRQKYAQFFETPTVKPSNLHNDVKAAAEKLFKGKKEEKQIIKKVRERTDYFGELVEKLKQMKNWNRSRRFNNNEICSMLLNFEVKDLKNPKRIMEAIAQNADKEAKSPSFGIFKYLYY